MDAAIQNIYLDHPSRVRGDPRGIGLTTYFGRTSQHYGQNEPSRELKNPTEQKSKFLTTTSVSVPISSLYLFLRSVLARTGFRDLNQL
ncbi:hypothetical protein K1719_012166 [Acacia pycnantha]|nr:hypothetical protein K1719_012166 [Acacia pycnantha]